ncbi:MAG: Crp/Fnr family transcriptional regulator [Oscillospiraceae bacterium]|nr:Crp/Fnr family transcriptional regulator [Oscillospiraceae bacterium]
MTAKDKKAFLKNELFSKLDIDFIAEKAEIVSAEKGRTIMKQNSFSRCLTFIIKGSAFVYKINLDGHRTIINRLSEGDVFGMATLFHEESEFPSEITAESNLRLAVLPKEAVEEAFFSCPDFAKAYVTLLSEKIHFLNKKLSAFSEGEASEKLLRWIITASNGEKEFYLPFSVSKLAEMLGIGRASVYRAFDTLSEKGIATREGKKIVILKP